MFYPTSRRGVAFHVFSELEKLPGFVHAFTSRETDRGLKGNADAAGWATRKPHLLESLGLDPERTFQLRQIHSAQVFAVAELNGQQEGDGLLVSQPGRFALVKTADCLPVLLVDPESRSLCLVHAGWRGTADRVVREGVRRLLEAGGADPKSIVAALGPCIRSCCYEVGPEVRREFEEKGHPAERVFQRNRLDLAEANRVELEKAGVGTVLDSGFCTSCRADLFYSWRRKKDAGRMWALAGFRGD